MYVYLIFDHFSRLTKIGRSTNPQKRLKDIRTANPSAELFFFSREYTEEYLHSRFAHKKVSGEWYGLDKDDLLSIGVKLRDMPKRLHYMNTVKDIKRKEAVDRKNKLLLLDFKWVWSLDEKYQFTKDGRCFNVQRGKEIKRTVIGYTEGFCLQGKFRSLKRLRSELKKIVKTEIPF